jgi:hypothetical protein
MENNKGAGNQNFPLEGLLVVEYGVFHAGPGASAILGDLGAEVVKIEDLTGDPERYWTKLAGMDMTMPNGESAMFQFSNRNKRSICLDINPAEGRGVFEKLVARADVFLTNLRRSTKKKLGIDYETLRSINSRMIHANVSGYGPKGFMSDMGAFDPLGLARSGMMFATGSPEPKALHIGILDQATAIAASHAMMTALFVRERTGRGQEVHVSLYSVGQWLMGPASCSTAFWVSIRSSRKTGRSTPLCATGIAAGTGNGSSAPTTRRKSTGLYYVRRLHRGTCLRILVSPRTNPAGPTGPRLLNSWTKYSKPERATSGWRSLSTKGSCSVRCNGWRRFKTTLKPWPIVIWWISKIRLLARYGSPDTLSTSAPIRLAPAPWPLL